VSGGIVLVVALAGIGVNLVATLVLSGASRESLNVRGAFLHVASDLAAFVGTAIAGAVIVVTGWNRADPIASLLVATLMFWAAYSLLRDSTAIFLELAPQEIDPDEVGRAIVSVPHVVEAHDLHVWTVTSGFPAVSAHVLVEPGADCHGVRREIEDVLRERFDLGHTTLQVDHAHPTVVTSFADAEYHVVVDAIRRWRAFAMEMVQLFERQGGRSDPAYQGAIRMVVLADQVLRILGQTEP